MKPFNEYNLIKVLFCRRICIRKRFSPIYEILVYIKNNSADSFQRISRSSFVRCSLKKKKKKKKKKFEQNIRSA